MAFNISTVTTQAAATAVETFFLKEDVRVKLHPFLWGAYGVAKSSIVKSIVASLTETTGNQWGFLDLRASQIDAVDTRGVPEIIDHETDFAPPRWLPNVERDGEFGVTFIDEILLGMHSVQASLYQLMTDGRLGSYIHPEGWHIIAASNRPEDGAGVHGRVDPALMNRFAPHYNVVPSVNEWTQWAYQNGVAHEVIAFIQFRGAPSSEAGGLLHEYLDGGAPKNHIAVATPRSWEFVSEIIKCDLPKKIEADSIIGAVGMGAGSEFSSFLRVMRDIPSFAQILDDPDGVPVPSEINTIYAVCAQLAAKCERSNISNAIKWLAKYDDELIGVLFALAIGRDDDFKNTQEYIQFKIDNQLGE